MKDFAELIKMITKNEVTSRVAKDVLKVMFQKGGDPSEIVKELGVAQVSDEGEIEAVIKKIIEANPEPVASYKKGKENSLQFLVGQVMRETCGKANPKIVQEMIKKVIS